MKIVNNSGIKQEEVIEAIKYILMLDYLDKQLLPAVENIKKVVVYRGKHDNYHFTFIN